MDKRASEEEQSIHTVPQHAEYAEKAAPRPRTDNPLAGYTHAELADMGEQYCRSHGLDSAEDVRAFRLGAIAAGDEDFAPSDTATTAAVDALTAEEQSFLLRETTHKWSHPRQLYAVILICSLCAAVQGMDETVVNGAQLFYKAYMGLDGGTSRDDWLVGLVNGAPYLCCAVLGCWLTGPMNARWGRRGTVLISCVISAVACIWQAFTGTWWHLFLARFALGLGIGPKSATTPMFAAECAPPRLRGALVMQWQVWTAFGILLGYVADLGLYFVPAHGVQGGLNWRLMLGAAMLPALPVVALLPGCVESPRWLLGQDRPADAYAALCRLRWARVQAARDLFYMQTLLAQEARAATQLRRGRWGQLAAFLPRRNRNGALASEVVMFMQQFCGVNVLAYYSSQIFVDANLGEVRALAASTGWGAINWVGALPAFYTIDTYGRRTLLLVTLPLMAVCLLLAGGAFWIPAGSQARIAVVALGLYLFGVVYSPGMGPVPFTYSAEAYPLALRPLGMSLATATTWFFNFVLSVTWPSLLSTFKPQGAFGWYAAWNVIGFVGVLLFVPETKARTLEELDAVFAVPLHQRMRHGCAELAYVVQRYVCRQDVQPPAEPMAALDERGV